MLMGLLQKKGLKSTKWVSGYRGRKATVVTVGHEGHAADHHAHGFAANHRMHLRAQSGVADGQVGHGVAVDLDEQALGVAVLAARHLAGDDLVDDDVDRRGDGNGGGGGGGHGKIS